MDWKKIEQIGDALITLGGGLIILGFALSLFLLVGIGFALLFTVGV